MPKESIPNPLISKVAIAETEDGEIAGYLVAQMVIHAEPIFIKKKFRHAVRFDKLAAKLDEAVGHKNVFCFSKSDIVEKMLKFVGFCQLPYKIWKRD